MEMGKRITQEEMVLNFMQEFGGITTWEAFTELGIKRLSDKIFELRKEWDIDDEIIVRTNRYGNPVHFKRYFIKKKLEAVMQI